MHRKPRTPPIQTHGILPSVGIQNDLYHLHALFYAGVTLVLGFVFMLVVDNCGARIIHHHGNQGLSNAPSEQQLFH